MNYCNYKFEHLRYALSKIGLNTMDIMITGVTGAGKSTTLNAILQKNVAKVGTGTDPETMSIDHYSLNRCFRLWDTPGLGDGVNADRIHQKKIVELLYKTYEFNGKKYGFIDLALIIIEGSNRDMGTTYKLLNEVIVPNIQSDRIFVAINQADFAMTGRHWLYDQNRPDDILLAYLNEQANSVQRRIKEATGVKIHRPVFYSAMYNYNITALLDMLINNVPTSRRSLVI